LTAALALIELDGIARRLVVSPPDVTEAHLSHVIETAGIDAVVSDGAIGRAALPDRVRLVTCSPVVAPAVPPPAARCDSEWVLLTSGTTGVPKLVMHTLASLVGAIQPNSDTPTDRAVWSTFYDIRRYGGMQIFFRGVIGGGSLVLSSAGEPVADFLARAGQHGVTYISGTPSHWRRALMSPAAGRIAPKYVRLSGEIADQAILDDLKQFYRGAGVAHAFATTEAGVAFAVNDGLAGFPAGLIGQHGEVEIKIEDGSLRIRSPRTAARYLGVADGALRGTDGFVDTGDIIEMRDGRCHFMGRRGGIINVGGLKVHPEEVEAVINRHPSVQMSLVKARKNPFTGAVVIAEVVVRPGCGGAPAAAAVQDEILAACRRHLAPHKVPAAIRFVGGLNVGSAGKLARLGA
jgi:acyl-coenzyme A synthetase/AMP-(fatty) acid ligase